MQQDISNILEQFLLVFHISGRSLVGLAPFIFVGIILGEIFRNLPWLDQLSHHCRRSSFISICLVAFLGVISPLCTYGTVPLVLMLLGKGFPLAPLVTFLIASSSLNPQLFFITIGGINLEMAFVRLGTVMLFSILAGLVTMHIPEKSILARTIPNRVEENRINVLPAQSKTGFRKSLHSMWKELKYIGFFILIGCIIGAVIEVYMPERQLAEMFGAKPLESILIAAILGVPAYVCGGGIIPVIGLLLSKGMNIGAVLTFLTVGQTIRITPLAALVSLVRVRYVIFFVISFIIYSLVIGFSYHLMKL